MLARTFLCALILPFILGQQNVALQVGIDRTESNQFVIREDQSILIDGQIEHWQLQWAKVPEPACAPDDPVAYTCPCIGFAFAERGVLDLVRIRSGRQMERLALTPLFEGVIDSENQAVLQRWELRESDSESIDANTVRSRPTTQVMNFADYDHDGESTEFLLQIFSASCGKRMKVAVGVSKSQPYLHVFGTAEHPNTPLVLKESNWRSLLDSITAAEVIAWQCGDHGAQTETRITLRTDGAGIHATQREYDCSEQTDARKIVDEHEL
jgi:hypothetical protein